MEHAACCISITAHRQLSIGGLRVAGKSNPSPALERIMNRNGTIARGIFALCLVLSCSLCLPTTGWSFSYRVEKYSSVASGYYKAYTLQEGPMTTSGNSLVEPDNTVWTPQGVASVSYSFAGPRVYTPDSGDNDDSVYLSLMNQTEYDFAVDFKHFDSVDNTALTQTFGLQCGNNSRPAAYAPWINMTWFTGNINGTGYTNGLVLNYGYFLMSTGQEAVDKYALISGLDPTKSVIGIGWGISGNTVTFYYRVNMSNWTSIASFTAGAPFGSTAPGLEIDIGPNPRSASIPLQWTRSLTTPTDGDSDGLLDTWEMQYFYTLVYNGGDDNDSDGLTNTEEKNHGTNPAKSDTDGDSYSDGDEVTAGTDPLDPNSFPQPQSSSLDISVMLNTLLDE